MITSQKFNKCTVGILCAFIRPDRDRWQTCEFGNERSGSIKCGEFLDYLRTG